MDRDVPVVVVLATSLGLPEIDRLCERASTLLRTRPGRSVVCDVGGLVDPDATAIDALARLQLTVHRLGSHVIVCNSAPELRRLIDLAGLADVVVVRAD